jgi:hypothetical protein
MLLYGSAAAATPEESNERNIKDELRAALFDG